MKHANTGGFTLIETMVTVSLASIVFASAFVLVSLSSDILAQVGSLVEFKNDAYRARETISREVRGSTLVQLAGELGQDMRVYHADGRIAHFFFSPGGDGSYDTLPDNELLYWRDLSAGQPQVLAQMVSRNGAHVFATRINPLEDVSGTLPVSDPSLSNNNLVVLSFRVGETEDFTFGGYGGAGVQGVEVHCTVLLRNATQNTSALLENEP